MALEPDFRNNLEPALHHASIFPEDLAPGYGLTLDSLATVHDKVLRAFAEHPEHAQTLASVPWAGQVLLATAKAEVATTRESLFDFDLAFNYWNWVYQIALYGRGYALAWDRLERSLYPRLHDGNLNAFTHAQGLEFVQNREEVIAAWQPVLPALINQLELSGVRIICNHATWMSQGFLIVMLHKALSVYCERNPCASARVAALGLRDPMEFGTHAYTLLGPWITTLGHKLSPGISDLPAIGAIQAISNVLKVFPDTPSGRFTCCHRRWQGEVRKVLRFLKTLESTPGTLIFETPSGMQDAQINGALVPQPMAKAAVRLSRARPNQMVLVAMDERDLFHAPRSRNGFQGGHMRGGHLHMAVKSYLGPRPSDSAPDWPLAHWQDMETQIADLIHTL